MALDGQLIINFIISRKSITKNDIAATYLYKDKSYLSRKPIEFSPKEWYHRLFDLTYEKSALFGENEATLLDALKIFIERQGLKEDVAYLWNKNYLEFINELLWICSTLPSKEKDSQEKREQFIERQNQNVLSDKEPDILCKIPNKTIEFFGRKKELARINEILETRNYVILTGIGGIGKSSTALEYAYNKKKDGWIIQHILCNESESLQDAVKRLEFDRLKDKNLEFDYSINLLKKCLQPTIIIFDNLDRRFNPNDLNDFKKLTRCGNNIKFIITSRDDKLLLTYYKEHTVKIKPLDNNDLLDFYAYNRFRDYDVPKNYIIEHKELLISIFERVYNHTLMIELLAKIARENGMDDNGIYEKLRLNISPETVFIVKDSDEIEDKVKGIITKLFDISLLNIDQINIMKNMAILPLLGMDLRLFKELFEYETDDQILLLRDRSWLVMDEVSKRISLHPLIAEVILDMAETKPSDAACRSSIMKILDKLNSSESNENLKSDLINAYLQILELTQKMYPESDVFYKNAKLKDEYLNLSVELQSEIHKQIFYLDFIKLKHENNITFKTFYYYVCFIGDFYNHHNSEFREFVNLFNKTHRWDDLEFQFYINLFNSTRECSDSEFEESIHSLTYDDLEFINKNYFNVKNILTYLHKCSDAQFNVFIKFIEFIHKCNYSIFQFYIDYMDFCMHPDQFEV